MKSHTRTISTRYCLFILGFTLSQGYGELTLEKNRTSDPSCYGATVNSFVNARCGDNSKLIFPLEVFVGAKPNSTGCKTYDDSYTKDDEELRDKCCGQINKKNDCIDEYHGANRTAFMTNCIGRTKCRQTRTVWESTRNMTCDVNETYTEESNYAYMEYYCIDRKRIATPMKDLKLRSTAAPLYLTAGSVDAYWDGIRDSNVTCSVKTSNKSVVEVWIMDLRLNVSSSQLVEISGGNSPTTLRNSNNNFIHPSLFLNNTFNINITFITTKHNVEFLWLGFRANTSGDFVEISCDESGRVYIQDKETLLSEEKKATGLMVGSAAGGLCLLAICIIIGVAIYRRYKFRKVGEEIKNLPENEETA